MVKEAPDFSKMNPNDTPFLAHSFPKTNSKSLLATQPLYLRSRSSSVQAAIDDPRLSTSLADLAKGEAAQARSPARLLFEKKVKKYYYQLTAGCGDEKCAFKLCASNQRAPKFAPEVAAVMAVQLASSSRPLFCPLLPSDISATLPFSLSPYGSPTPSASSSRSHSRASSAHLGEISGSLPNLKSASKSDLAQQKQMSALDSVVPKPFLNSLFSYPSFTSMFGDGKPAHPARLRSASQSYHPLHLSRSDVQLNMLSAEISKQSLPAGDVPQPSSPDSVVSDSSDQIEADARASSKPSLGIEETISLKILNLELLEIAVEPYTSEPVSDQTADHTFLLNTIHGVFSSIDALGASFLTSAPAPALDIPSIPKAYDVLLALRPAELFRKKLVHAIEMVLAKLYIHVKNQQNPDIPVLRTLVILLLNPLCQETLYHDSMVKRLCCVMGKIRSRSNAVLVEWFSKLDPHNLTVMIQIFKSYILALGPPAGKPEENFVGAVKALSLLSSANEYGSLPLVPISEFYISDRGFRLNFKDEFRRWKRSLEAPQITEFALFNYPFLFDPVAKARIMHIDAMVKMSLEYEDACVNQALVMHAQRFLDDSDALKTMEEGMKESTNPYLVLEVRRTQLVADVLAQISRKGADLKKPLKIKFVGGGEEGMDQGGVQKEFFQVIMSELLDPSFGMFSYDAETRYSWINSASLEPASQFELVGTILGLALYNGVIVRVSFPPLMYKKLLKEDVTLKDVETAFPALGKGLRQLLDWEDGDVADIFMRTFEISYDAFGKVEHIPLVPGGADLMVTNENREAYVRLYIKHLVTTSVQDRFRAFQKGFYKVCGGKSLAMCRPSELELLICGKTTDDVEFRKLEEGAGYDDGYSTTHMVIK
ncbi:hypothetical protein HDU91_005277 [Kappamyces sp. JEL0680]|nr:hypothetical protein HDU91_005277 [Kappamyces sp. JEL0680]